MFGSRCSADSELVCGKALNNTMPLHQRACATEFALVNADRCCFDGKNAANRTWRSSSEVMLKSSGFGFIDTLLLFLASARSGMLARL